MDLATVTDLVVPAARADLPAWRPGDAFLAGGSWLFSEPQRDLRRLVDLGGLGWAPLVESPTGLEIAATCTLAQLAAHVSPWPAGWLLRACCDTLLGSFKVWNVATVGGNICLALPAAPMVALAAGLDGVATVWCPDGTTRTLPVLDLVTGARRTALAPGELLRSVLLPAASLAQQVAVRQFSLTTHGRSAVLIVGRADPDGVVLTVTASTVRPVRVRAGDDLDAACAGLWHDDVHGDPRWRRALTHRLAAQITAELGP